MKKLKGALPSGFSFPGVISTVTCSTNGVGDKQMRQLGSLVEYARNSWVLLSSDQSPGNEPILTHDAQSHEPNNQPHG